MQAVEGSQGEAGAGEPPGQKKPGWHCVALAEEVEPEGQPKPGAAVQAAVQAAVVRPVVAPYTPGGQGLQAAAPVKEKLPAGHRVQTASDVDPVALLKVPAGQAIGDSEDNGQKKPAGHSKGAAPGVQKYEATQCSIDVLKIVWTQADAPVAPVIPQIASLTPSTVVKFIS